MKSDCKENAFRDALQNLADEVTAVIAVTDKGEHVIASNCDRVYRALCDAKDALAAAQRSAAANGGETNGSGPAVINVKRPPTLEELLDYAHKRLGFFDDAFTREWHRVMSEEYQWRGKDGKKIKNWPGVFHSWRENRAAIEKFRDPDRISDARKNARGRLSNHVDISKEERDDLLGKCGF